MANVKVGEAAPDFTLKNQDNADVTLSALRGSPVVLLSARFLRPLHDGTLRHPR